MPAGSTKGGNKIAWYEKSNNQTKMSGYEKSNESPT